jgi:hypothetical protein
MTDTDADTAVVAENPRVVLGAGLAQAVRVLSDRLFSVQLTT